MINYSPACDRNQAVIAEQLASVFANCRDVLEIGSYSGQHVMYFAQQLPQINWQPADLPDLHGGLAQNIANFQDQHQHQHGQPLANLYPPISLDLRCSPWLPEQQFDGLFSANTLHIMAWHHVEAFFVNAAKQLKKQGILAIYGPFKYQGEFTSPSNANFELWLKNRDPASGVRDFEAINQLAQANGLVLGQDLAMPANNQLLSFLRV